MDRWNRHQLDALGRFINADDIYKMREEMSTLFNKLIVAPEHQIRAVLLSLCTDHDTKVRALTKYKELSAYDQPARALKRKAYNDLFICAQCSEPFSHEDNEKGCCVYHPGYICLNDSSPIWKKNKIKSKEAEEEWRVDSPEGFQWECCKNAIHIKGCVRGRDEAHPDKSKRGGDSPHYKREYAKDPEADEAKWVVRDEDEGKDESKDNDGHEVEYTEQEVDEDEDEFEEEEDSDEY